MLDDLPCFAARCQTRSGSRIKGDLCQLQAEGVRCCKANPHSLSPVVLSVRYSRPNARGPESLPLPAHA